MNKLSCEVQICVGGERGGGRDRERGGREGGGGGGERGREREGEREREREEKKERERERGGGGGGERGIERKEGSETETERETEREREREREKKKREEDKVIIALLNVSTCACRLELVVEPWIDGLWDSLEAILSPSSERSGTGVCHDTASELHVLVQTVVKVPLGTCTSIKDSQSVRNVDEIRTIDGSGDRGDRIESVQRKVVADNVKQIQLGNDELRAVKSGRSAAAVSELALSFEDKVSVSKEPSSLQTVSSSMDKSMSSITERDKVKEGQSSPAEVGVATASRKDSNGGSKRKSNSREDGSAMEELKTPSRELAGVSLNLPSVQPSFIKVLLKNVSVFMHASVAVHVHACKLICNVICTCTISINLHTCSVHVHVQ